MTREKVSFSELWSLFEALGEDRITQPQMVRLERILRSNPEARQHYLAYIDLHGSLYWDAGLPEMAAQSAELSEYELSTALLPPTVEEFAAPVRRRGLPWMTAIGTAAALLAGLWAGGLLSFGPAPDVGPAPEMVEREDGGNNSAQVAKAGARDGTTRRQPLQLSHRDLGTRDHGVGLSDSQDTSPFVAAGGVPGDSDETAVPVVEAINARFAARWREEGIEPSPLADDAEWVRRVYLDLTGRIPPAGAVEAFFADERPDKRERLVDRLLDDPAYVRNWTTVLTNLLVGRAESENVNRPALENYLSTSLAQNRGWDRMVVDFIAAEGSNTERGETNFLLAHLNNQAVPATAITSRIFLGMQVQCTQCHDHPFSDLKQNHFWELNSFFKQTAMVRRPVIDPETGKAQGAVPALVSRPLGGPTDYETRRGLVQVAYPKFDGIRVDESPEVNRREHLAELMVAGEKTQVAVAMVNRMWHHFFGYAFTLRVDDMGPHDPPSHPEVVDRLAREFVRSGYDLKQLMRWICTSRPYQLTSRFNEQNGIDDPAAGQPALFSRMYVKSMTAEQAYDSLLVATSGSRPASRDWQAEDRRRREWLQQFVMEFETDENDEAMTFDGTIPQALMMMNGQVIQAALNSQSGTFNHVLAENITDAERFRRLFLAALSRYPTEKETAAFRRLLRQYRNNNPRPANTRTVPVELLQDIFWACLNSNEFILIH